MYLYNTCTPYDVYEHLGNIEKLTAKDGHRKDTKAKNEHIDSDEVREKVFGHDFCHDEERLCVVAGCEEPERTHSDRKRIVR